MCVPLFIRRSKCKVVGGRNRCLCVSQCLEWVCVPVCVHPCLCAMVVVITCMCE